MSVTITLGRAGRLVVPKAIGKASGFAEGTRLRIESSAGYFEAIPEADEVQIQVRGGFPVISRGGTRMKGEIVKAIKAGREERADRILAHRKKK